MEPETFGWGHFATLGTMLLSLVAIGLSIWSNRKTDKAVIQQSEGCRLDHVGIRGVLVSQGEVAARNAETLSRLVDSHASAVTAFTALAHTLDLRQKDEIFHRAEVTRILNSIEQKLSER